MKLYEKILKSVSGFEPIPTAVAYPCDSSSLHGPISAAQDNLISPILIGPTRTIRKVAEESSIDLSDYRIIDAVSSQAAANRAVELVRDGEAEIIMKGSLHTDELLSSVISRTKGIRTSRRMSHVFVMDVPNYHKLLMVTDAAVNVAPDLISKRDICQNAIDLGHSFGIEKPRLAILAAVETVNPGMQSTLDAAALCKMADRGQISGGLLDGPLAMDNAISEEAARTKGIKSEVAGNADVLVVPNIEAGNILAKQIIFMSNADSAGIVLGAEVPIILTSRAESVRSRLCSTATAVMHAHAIRRGI